MSHSDPQRAQTNSPVLKSYTILAPEESLGPSGISSSGALISSSQLGQQAGGNPSSSNGSASSQTYRQFHSLPRMSTETERTRKIKRSFETEFDKESKYPLFIPEVIIRRHCFFNYKSARLQNYRHTAV